MYYLHIWLATVLKCTFLQPGVPFTAECLIWHQQCLYFVFCLSLTFYAFLFLNKGKPKCFHTSGLKLAGASTPSQNRLLTRDQ